MDNAFGEFLVLAGGVACGASFTILALLLMNAIN